LIKKIMELAFDCMENNYYGIKKSWNSYWMEI